MRILVFLIFLTTLSYSQISQRCPVCPPSLNGVPNGYVLTDSSGKAVWQSPSGGSGDTTFAWSIHGNSGTNPLLNFLGTNDGQDLHIEVYSEFEAFQSVIGMQRNNYDNTSESAITMIASDSINNFYKEIQISQDSLYLKSSNFIEDTSVSFSLLGVTATVNGSLKINDGTQGAGKVLTSDADGLASWQPFTGTPIKDSIAATGATVSPAINTTHVITSAGAITSATLSFPSGVTGNWIIVVFNKAIATLTNSGTGATTVGLVAPLLGTSKTYVNVGGNWY